MNKKSLEFVLEIQEGILPLEKIIEVSAKYDKSSIVKEIIDIDELRDMIPLSRTLDVISHKDINIWDPKKLVNN